MLLLREGFTLGDVLNMPEAAFGDYVDIVMRAKKSGKPGEVKETVYKVRKGR